MIDKNYLHKSASLSFESEADEIDKNREPNTYYPILPDLLQNAFNEINKIRKKELSIYCRIKEKLLKAKKGFVDILSIASAPMIMKLPDSWLMTLLDSVNDVIIKTRSEALVLLLNIPIISKNEVDSYKKSSIPLFDEAVRFNSKGNAVGYGDPQESHRTEAHIYFRQKRVSAILVYKDVIKKYGITFSEKDVYSMLKIRIPKFIVDEDRLLLWAKGITAGFNDDYITASHILMPQLEHGLHNLAEISHGTITKLAEKRQEEPSLGSIFKLLDGGVEEEFKYELESFLQSGIDVNFRNNLLHGLFSSFEIEKYGIYLWWLCLKLYFKLDEFLVNKKLE
jgi:hypothetical protein